VKCGEEKPHCHRCIKFGCVCDGYDQFVQQAGTLKPKRKVIHPLQPKINGASQLARDPAPFLFHGEREAWYFENFSSKTSHEILPDFNNGSLRQMLLQAAQEEPSIRHAIIALGALDVANEQTPTSPTLSQSRHQLDAFYQYAVALKLMKVRASIFCGG
jgi:Fungal Zn(2)-Cys(6) binuclear cluster domain